MSFGILSKSRLLQNAVQLRKGQSTILILEKINEKLDIKINVLKNAVK